LNDAFTSQSKIGCRNFLKGRISKKWGVLLTPKIKTEVIEAFERSKITFDWRHSLQIWDFRNDEYHRDELRSVPEYKQQALDDKIREAYHQKDTLIHPMNPLREQLFDIQIDELLIMSYNIRNAWLRSALLYLQRAEAHDMLTRGSENSFILYFTSGRPSYATPF
jgi:hypothetical protein